MASRSKRSRISMSPTRPEFPATGMWDTEKPTVSVGAQKLSQNPTLAMPMPMPMEMAPDCIGHVQVQPEKQAPNPKSLMSLGLATSDPAKRNLPPPVVGEFLKACRWCSREIGPNEDIYMYGNLGAFCKPECRENKINLDKFNEKHYSKSGLADKGTGRVKRKDDPM